MNFKLTNFELQSSLRDRKQPKNGSRRVPMELQIRTREPSSAPRGSSIAKVSPQGPLGKHSGASGSTPGRSKIYVFLQDFLHFQDSTDL